jgi:2-phospho-L-lactate/phosphoenolpyruvate guanylyltransferase
VIDWVVLVPVKRFDQAKSRLGARPDRAALAEAFARDTLTAVAGSERVRMLLVMTDAPQLVEDLSLPVSVTVRMQRGPGLNTAIAEGLRYAAESWPEFGQTILTGDLPALTPIELDRTLELAEEIPLGLVPDASGSGTTLLSGQPGLPLVPAFGPSSAQRHRDLGHRQLRAADALRRDVDTEADLAIARRLGVGARTAALLR